jgi:site-specific recombinase XerD
MTNDHNRLREAYLKELKLSGKSVKHVTYALGIFFSFLAENDLDLATLRINPAQEFQLYLITRPDESGKARYSKASVLNLIGSVSNFYEFLKRKKVVYANPFLEIDRVKRNESLPKNVLSEKNMDRFLSRLGAFGEMRTLSAKRRLYKAHVVAELMYSTGARVNEISKLKPADIDLEGETVKLKDSKTGKERIAFLNPYALGVLKIYLEETRNNVLFGKNGGDKNLLFGSKTHLKTWLNAILRKEGDSLGFENLTSHSFRHAVGYHLLRGGIDIRYIQEILGHKNLSATQVYTKVDKEGLRKVLEQYHPRAWKAKKEENEDKTKKENKPKKEGKP